jgi:hypothetical protein
MVKRTTILEIVVLKSGPVVSAVDYRIERSVSRGSELLLHRRRIEFEDLRKAIFPGGVGAGDEGSAHLGRVPARNDAETRRLFGFDVTCGKNLHVASLTMKRWRRSPGAGEGFSLPIARVSRDPVRTEPLSRAFAGFCCKSSVRSLGTQPCIRLEANRDDRAPFRLE